MNATQTRVFQLPDRIDSLQALRFLGAMCITVYHFTGLQGSCPFDFSHAVYLFYIISGFVVMLSTKKPEKKKYYLTRRLIRTLPLYWGLTVVTFFVGLAVPSVIGYRPTAGQLVKSLLFIPYQRTTAKAGNAIRPIVGLGHTLQMEMLFYLLFGLAMRISHKYRGVLAAVFAAAVALFGIFVSANSPVIHFYTVNTFVWVSFIIGLALYGVFSLLQKKELTVRYRWAPMAVSVAVAVALAAPALLRETSVWYDIGMFAVVFCAGLIWSACGGTTHRLPVTLGNISFSYYLLHYYTVALAARRLGIDCFSVKNLLLAALVSAVTWGISWVSWYLIENKLTAFLQRHLIRAKE